MSDTTSRIHIWDGWRGLAILLVLIGHFFPAKWIWEERMGVDIFFVLSGMLMSNILFHKKIHLKDFYIRRMSRVMPAFFVFLCVAYTLGYFKPIEFHISEFLSSLVFLRSYLPSEPYFMSTKLPVGHLWSLYVEEHSYMIMSLLTLTLLAKRYIAFIMIAIFIASIALCFYHYNNAISVRDFKMTLFRTETTIGFIMFSAGYYLIKQQFNIRLGKYASLICLLAAALLYLRIVPIWLTFTFAPVLLGIAVNHLTESAKGLESILLNRVMRQLGMISFSVYLWQQIFYKFWYAVPGGRPVALAASIMVGMASFYLLENPVRNFINRHWSPNPGYQKGAKRNYSNEEAQTATSS